MRQNGHVELIGTSPAIRDLRLEVERVARADAKVLITGESGAGKEVVARAIHAASPRAKVTFAPVNCGGIPETLLESGAIRPRPRQLHRGVSRQTRKARDRRPRHDLSRRDWRDDAANAGSPPPLPGDVRNSKSRRRSRSQGDRRSRDVCDQSRLARLDCEGRVPRRLVFTGVNVIHIAVPALREGGGRTSRRWSTISLAS